MESMVLYAVEFIAICLFAFSIVTDLNRRQIPNTIPVALLVLFAVYAAIGGIQPLGSMWENFAIGAVVLVLGIALYMSGRFGAGDSKLLAVAGVWIGPSLVYMSIFMCVFAAFTFALCMFALLPMRRTRRMRSQLPFAIAIAPPAMIAMAIRALSSGV